MAKKNQLTVEDLGIQTEEEIQESDKEREIQELIGSAMKFMDDHPDITEVRVGLAGPYRKFVQTMFPGVENVAGGIVASSLNSLHLQIRQPAGYPRCAFLRQKLFRCDIDIVFTETPGFSVFLLPLHDKSIKQEQEDGGVAMTNETDAGYFVDSDEDAPKRLAISMVYDLDKKYKDQVEVYQKEALNCIQQFCTLRDDTAAAANQENDED